MEVKLGVYGEAPVEETAAPAAEAPAVDNTPQEVTVTTEETGIEIPATPAVVTDPAAQPAAEPAPDEATFELPSFGGEPPAADPAPAQPAKTWQEAVSTANVDEVLKHLGLDDFTIQLHKHIANGGSASDYVTAKGRDWSKIPDVDIMRDEYRKMYPNFTEEEVETMLSETYSLDDEFNTRAQLQLKGDAYRARQQRIEQDAKFQIAEPQRQSAVPDNSAEVAAQQEQAKNFFLNHEATVNLNQTKRVVVDLGDGQAFKFNIDRPELLTEVITNGEVWQKVMATKTGEPDVAKLQMVSLFSLNPQKFCRDLVNYGKSMGHLKEVEEGRNAVVPGGRPADVTQEKASYRVGTYGSRP